MFSYDKTLVDESQIGDVLLRHKHYSGYLDRLDILVPATVGKRQTEMKVSEKLTVYPGNGPKMLSWLRAYLKARRICREGKVDIVVTQDALLGSLGVLLRKEFGCKLQINAFGLEIFSDWWLEQNLLHRMYKLVMCWTLHRADLIRTDATRSKTALVEKLKIPPEKVVVIPVIPGPENIAKFTNADGSVVRRSLLDNKYDKVVLFTGVLEKIKNIPNLLRAAKLVLSVHSKTLFLLIGGGPERSYLERLCRELGIAEHVRFLGIIPYDELPSYFAACDVFVLSSWSEGFPRVLLEATFTTKPVVVTDVGGVNDIVADSESGYIVAVNNSKQLAERIVELLSNPDKANRMGQQGYDNTLKYHDFDTNVEKLVTAWKTMAEINGGRQ